MNKRRKKPKLINIANNMKILDLLYSKPDNKPSIDKESINNDEFNTPETERELNNDL